MGAPRGFEHPGRQKGELDLVLPLSEGAKPHRIQVKAAPEAKQLTTA